MTKRFLIFGCLGWCIEILWTGFHSLFLAVRKSCPLWQRLGLYSVTIFLVEFAAGGLIRLATGVCPWDYGNNPLSVLGLIRLDYAPLWAALGCFFEEVSLLLAKKGELA